jgi:hypothetical protein
MRLVCVLTVAALLAACPSKPPPPPPIPDSGVDPCGVDEAARAAVELGRRAEAGEAVVAEDGCSLFDGKLLARGFPKTVAQARNALKMEERCAPSFTAAGSLVTLGYRDGVWWVTRVKNVTDDRILAEEHGASAAIQNALIQAARCPSASRRLRSEADASVAVAYGLATDALRKVLSGETDKEPIPPDTKDALARVCKAVQKPTPSAAAVKPKAGLVDVLQGAVANPSQVEPLAAMALVMAGSLAVFGSAAAQVNMRDKALEAVRPHARGVLGAAPKTNLEGVCATWAMVEGALTPQPATTGKAPAKKKK